jgi:hypothetical protein
MVLTNALLSIGFSLVSNFANVVEMPAEVLPRRVEELREYFIGDPHSPIDLYLVHRGGTMFGIRDGAVTMFESPGSYIKLQDPSRVPEFFGEPTLSSNQVLELATKTIEKLVRTTNPIANIKPLVERPKKINGKEIPFYEISWPKPHYTPGFGYFAGLEIDARNGRITALQLHDPGFCDYEFAQAISNRVYIADAPKTVAKTNAPFRRVLPCPTTNEVEQAIASWLWLCQKLKIDPGQGTNLAAVDWDRSLVFTNSWLHGSPVEIAVWFTNGDNFCSVHGVALSHTASDTYFVGWNKRTGEELLIFKGKVKHHWEDLAKNLERVLIEEIKVPKKCFAAYASRASSEPPEFGTETLKRVRVEWTDRQNRKEFGFGAEFDLETGEIKSVGFRDPKILDALGRAQSNAK